MINGTILGIAYMEFYTRVGKAIESANLPIAGRGSQR